MICVSTQLIECGVDLSLGCAIRSLAGADNIAQTAGRCNRHGLTELRPVYIILSAEEHLDKLHDIRKAQQACRRSLHDCHDDADCLQLPGRMNDYYTYYYALQNFDMSYNLERRKTGLHASTTMVDLLSTNTIGATALYQNTQARPSGVLKQAFSTAGQNFAVIDDSTTGIIVPYMKGNDLIADLNNSPSPMEEKRLLREAQLYSVNIYSYKLRSLIDQDALLLLPCGAYALMHEWYDGAVRGLLDEPEYRFQSV